MDDKEQKVLYCEKMLKQANQQVKRSTFLIICGGLFLLISVALFIFYGSNIFSVFIGIFFTGLGIYYKVKGPQNLVNAQKAYDEAVSKSIASSK